MSTTIPSPSALGGRLAQKVPRRYIFSDDLTRLSRLDREFDDIVWSASSGTYDRAGGDLECSAKLFSARFYKMLGIFTDVCNVLLLCTRVIWSPSFGLRVPFSSCSSIDLFLATSSAWFIVFLISCGEWWRSFRLILKLIPCPPVTTYSPRHHPAQKSSYILIITCLSKP